MQIIPKAHKQHFLQTLLEGLGKGVKESQDLKRQEEALSRKLQLQQRLKNEAMKAENVSLAERGIDLSGITDPSIRKSIVGEKLKGDTARDKERKEAEKKNSFVYSQLERVDRLKDIRKKGNLGFGSSYTQFLSPEAQKDFKQYEQETKRLINEVSPIIVRNRFEFEKFAHDLTDPTLTDAQAEGILEGMQQILLDNLQDFDEDAYSPFSSQINKQTLFKKEPTQSKPPLSSFNRD